MDPQNHDVLSRNSIFGWIALATGLVLLIPLIAMQFTTEVSWNTTDFIVMGTLLFGAASLFVLVSRKAPRRQRLLIAVLFAAVFIFIWAELAVGIFTNLGS